MNDTERALYDDARMGLAQTVEALESLGGRSLNHAEWYLLLIYLKRGAKAIDRAKKR